MAKTVGESASGVMSIRKLIATKTAQVAKLQAEIRALEEVLEAVAKPGSVK